MSFFEVLKFEFKSIFTNIPIVLTIVGGVILYSFFYPQPYINQVVKTLKVSVVDMDRSDISRKIIFNLKATPKLNVIREDLSMNEAKKALLKGEVKGIILIPNNFKKDLSLLKTPTIFLGADANYFLVYGSVVEGALSGILTTKATIKISNLLLENTPLEIAKKTYNPYTINTINLFNTDMSYTYYVIPAVFILILQQTMLVGLGILGGFFNEYKKEYLAPVWMKIGARSIIFFTLFLLSALIASNFSFSSFSLLYRK